ncbi:MAG: hypothetical protein M3680_09455 [Myxococcota bacterium]|nr:hypothetical protein [Myxococcota bacterium]
MRSLIVCSFVCLFPVACGDGGAPATDAAPLSSDAATHDASGVICNARTAGGTHKLFLQFEGQTVTRGENDATQNTARWVAQGRPTATIPAWRPMAADRAAHIETVTCRVREALYPFDVDVVTTRPSSGDYEMVVIGGSSADLGHAQGISGFSGVDCENSNVRDIAWVADRIESGALEPALVANNIGGVVGVGNGLDASSDPANCMCFARSATDCDAAAACGFAVDATRRAGDQICGDPDATEDQLAKLVARYGLRP